jgi:hypothetical protein
MAEVHFLFDSFVNRFLDPSRLPHSQMAGN